MSHDAASPPALPALALREGPVRTVDGLFVHGRRLSDEDRTLELKEMGRSARPEIRIAQV